MRIDLSSIDKENFMVHEHSFAGEVVYLVQCIHIGANYTKDNLIFRSSVWDSKGYPVSLSFCKFFNWGEKPDLALPPESLAGAQLMEKIDGSTLIFSRYNGQTMIRTRGTTDARKLDNGYEIDVLLAKYPKLFEYFEDNCAPNSCYSYIFEWVSPTNKIVIDYGVEPDMFLTAVISHENYSMQSQQSLDELAEALGLRRPKTYNYDSIDEMKAAVEAFQGVEGLCVYYHDGQNILKVKSAQYLFLHRAKSDIGSLEKVIDLYLNQSEVVGHNMSYQEAIDYLTKTYDYEIAMMARGHISNIADGMKEVEKIVEGMKKFIETCRIIKVGKFDVALNDKQVRKNAAEKIFQAYGPTNRSGMVFKCLDSKSISTEDLKKLLFQVLKNK
jgi:hypothetical protein